MCGGDYHYWKFPKQLTKINGEPLVVRTIRLLTENGVDKKDIIVTASMSTESEFKKYCDNVVVDYNNWFDVTAPDVSTGYWCDCFMKMTEPTTYLMGDVVFSPEAIKKIVETETDDIEFFASAPPFDRRYSKIWAEPFAFKVVNLEHLDRAKEITKRFQSLGKFNRKPIAWEFWQIVKGTEINKIDYTNYTVINDYTCDIDTPDDIYKFEGGGE